MSLIGRDALVHKAVSMMKLCQSEEESDGYVRKRVSPRMRAGESKWCDHPQPSSESISTGINSPCTNIDASIPSIIAFCPPAPSCGSILVGIEQTVMEPLSDAGRRSAPMKLDEDQSCESLNPILDQASIDRAGSELIPKKFSLVGAASKVPWGWRRQLIAGLHTG